MAVVAPIPSARVRTATPANPGCFLKMRAAYRRLCTTAASAEPVDAPDVIDERGCACRSGAMALARTSDEPLNSLSSKDGTSSTHGAAKSA